MNDNCKDCYHIENLKSEIQEIKVKVNALEGKVSVVEKTAAINEEQTKMVFKILNEIKDSIEKIGNKIDEIESRPSKLIWGIGGTIIGALIIAGIKFLN